MVGADPQPSFDGTLKVGSEGGGPGTSSFLSLGSATSDVVTIGDQPIYLGAVATQAVPLPADAGDEVLLTIVPRSSVCGPVRYSEGLLIDDLRLE